MNKRALNTILRIKEWEEELEKNKYASLLMQKKYIERYIRGIEERFNYIEYVRNVNLTSDELDLILSEIQYLTNLLNEAKAILEKTEKEVERQREIYEESHKEKKKIEQLYERLISFIRREREKNEEKIIADIFSSRYRSI